LLEREAPAIALGASIEVQGQVMAARGERSTAVDFSSANWLAGAALHPYSHSEKHQPAEPGGKPAPPLETLNEHLGLKPARLPN